METQVSPRTVGQNLRVLLPLAIFQTVVYLTVNHVRWLPARPLPMTALDRWIPFWPWTAVPYLLFFLGAFLLALMIRTNRVLRQAVTAYFLCLAMTVAIFVFSPTLCPRPNLSSLGDTWAADFYRWLAEIDTKACSFPSLHIILPAIVCWTTFAEKRPWAGWCAAAMLILSITILTTKQHYAWDWLGGLIIACIGIWLAGRFMASSST